MEFSLIKAGVEHSFLMENLMQFYIYDFSKWLGLDVMRNGLFKGYERVESYWKQEDKAAYLVKSEEQFVGFALIKRNDSKNGSTYSIAEFFILKKYRMRGLGKEVAFLLFDLYKGNWQIFQLAQNRPAQLFWYKIINEYTEGNFNSFMREEKCFQEFDNRSLLQIA